MRTHTVTDPVLTVREVAELLGVSYRTVLRRIDDGSLRAVRRGGRFFVRQSWIDEFLTD